MQDVSNEAFDAGVKAAAERCKNALDFDQLGDPVKWKDIKWTFYHLAMGHVFDNETGLWKDENGERL